MSREYPKLTEDECRQLIAEWDAWAEEEHPFGIPHSELWRRAKHAREHPETLIPHAEVMRQLREKISPKRMLP